MGVDTLAAKSVEAAVGVFELVANPSGWRKCLN